MAIKRNPTTGKIIAKRFTLERVQQGMADSSGFCIACGAECEGVEPDARRYACEDCGLNLVYGAEELLMQGRVD